jgi:hypothetical protein
MFFGVNLFAVFCVLLAVGVPAALANQASVFQGSFGCAKEAGCTKTPDPYPLAPDPWSAAVNDTTGNVYVTDAVNHRVEEFTSKGEFVLMFGKAVNKTKQAGFPSEANVCTEEEVELMSVECQPGAASPEPDGFDGEVLFVAVDNSAGPSSGDVYVGDYVEHGAGNRVSKFTSSGGLVSGWGKAGEIDGSGITSPPAAVAGPFGRIQGLAVDPSGNLWVAGEHVTFEYNQEVGASEAKEVTGSNEVGLKTDWPTPVFSLPFGVAVGSHDDVYFLQAGQVLEVSATGAEVGAITEPGEDGHQMSTFGVAVDPASDQLHVLDEPEGFVPARVQLQRYEPGCRPSPVVEGPACTAAETFTNQHLTGELGEAHGVAINPGAGKPVYVTSREKGEVRFFSVVTVPGVSTGKPSKLTGATAVLEGAVNPSGVALEEGEPGCRFEWGLAGAAYEHTAGCAESAGEIGSGMSEVPVHAEIKGLQAGVSYHYRLVAANVNDVQEPVLGGDVAFGPPVIESESSVDVAASTAVLQAEVDPQNVDTRVRVEYGLGVGYGQSTGELDIGAGSGAGGGESVRVELQGLAAGTEYHYRFVAENVLGEGAGAAVGADRVLKTQGAGAFRLPDSRGWELVSARDRHGASIEPLASSYDAGGAIQAASGGDAISYVTNIPIEDGVQGFPEFAQVLSTRSSTGWASRDLSVPHSGTIETGDAVTAGREYRMFSEDLSKAGVQPAGEFEPCTNAQGAPQPCLSPEASEQTAVVQDLGSGVFTPLVTGCPPVQEECPAAVAEHENVPPGTVFGKTGVGSPVGCPPLIYCGPFFEDATPDFSHVVVDSPVRLTEEADATAGEGLYEASAGKLAFVGAGSLGASGNQDSTDDRHAISVDGSRVFWTAGSTHQLYMRDMATGELLQVDAPEAECVAKGKCAAGGGEFQLASSGGERVFFTDGARLTMNAGATAGSPDLYECEIVETAGKLGCVLTDLTPASGGEAAGVQGVVVGASEDGSYVYFVANGVLGDGVAHGATPGDCEVSEARASGELCNLYVWHEGVTRLVAVLSGMDEPDWGARYLGAPTARVSPDGQWLAFMSERSLTGYDNRDAVSGEPDEEVYLYNAVSERLVCASCNATGQRPHGERYGNENGGGLENGLVGSFKVWYLKTWLAANVPTWTPVSYTNALLQSRYLSDSGRLFFNSSDSLVPKDGNGQEDVYEYEPEGVGAETARCGPGAVSGSEVLKPEHEYEVLGVKGVEGAGCVALISSGTSSAEAAFMEASESGSDVFFLTAAHLVAGSIENGESLYDAHECTSASPCTPETEVLPPCETAEGCRAAPEPEPSVFGAPPSATFQGAGNPAPETPAGSPAGGVPKTPEQVRAEKLAKALKVCRKQHKPGKKRSLCEKTARKRYAPAKKARKASKHSSKASRASGGRGVGR